MSEQGGFWSDVQDNGFVGQLCVKAVEYIDVAADMIVVQLDLDLVGAYQITCVLGMSLLRVGESDGDKIGKTFLIARNSRCFDR